MARTESQVNLLLFDSSILSILINTYHYSTNHVDRVSRGILMHISFFQNCRTIKYQLK